LYSLRTRLSLPDAVDLLLERKRIECCEWQAQKQIDPAIKRDEAF
jgi:hypothetical protein